MEKFKRIALLMGKNIGYNRDVIQGVYAFSQKRKNWIFHDAAPNLEWIEWVREWQPDGVIGHFYNEEVAKEIEKLGVPVVNTTDSLLSVNYPLADVNQYKVGELAAEYLLGLGVRNLAYLGSKKIQYSKQRLSGFSGAIDGEVDVCDVPYMPRITDFSSLKVTLSKMREWVEKLPKPVGIFCSNDVPARDLADVCLELGIEVPKDVAIIGVDNDLVECRLSRPPLTSIEIPSARIGFGAAEMLDKLMKGEPLDESTFQPNPIRVVERESTNMNAVGDNEVKKAMEYMQSNFAQIETVEDVVAAVSIGRRALELRFRNVLGKSPLEVLHLKRIAHAKLLLVKGGGDFSRIAEECGYQSAVRFSQVFKKYEGCSPQDYSKRYKI